MRLREGKELKSAFKTNSWLHLCTGAGSKHHDMENIKRCGNVES